MKISKVSAIALLAGTTLLVGCQSAQEKEFAQNTTELSQLAPMSKPTFSAGEKFSYIDLLASNKVIESNVTSVSDKGTTFLNSRGCEYLQTDPFRTSAVWNNCDGSGSANVEVTGDIWPLQIGNTVTQKITGMHEGESWGGTNRCEVVSAQNILIQGKNLDTFKVVCKRGKRVKTYYMSPEHKRPVVYQYKSGGQYKRHTQLVVTG